MQRLISMSLAAAISAAALGPTASLAQPYPPGPHGPPGGPPSGFYRPPPHAPQQWHRGDYYYGKRYVVHDWQHYRLRPPPAGYQWVQSGGQFVLIAVASGVVTEIILSPR